MEVWSRKEILVLLYEKERSLGMLYSLRKQYLQSEDKEMKYLIEKNISLDESEVKCLRMALS